ncbi:MAG: hypothetical protein KKH93_05980 [Candidatus Omnitrophica bacterium]|nr:hypothetical protein [Candidatus Omnitrophota bacterium]
MDSQRVVITGIGPIASIGIGKDEVWSSVTEGKTGLKSEEYSISDKASQKFYLHKAKDFKLCDLGIDKAVLNDIQTWKDEEIGKDLKYILGVVKLALDDSRLSFDPKDTKNKVGLVLTHENPGLDDFYQKVIDESFDLLKNNSSISKEEYFKGFFGKFQKRAYDLQTFMFLYHAAKAFGFHGYSLFINNACASGLYALEAAADIIKSGKCQAVISAGVDLTSIFKLLWFKGIGMYAEDGLIKPFSKDRNGFVFGEGGAGIVLESLESAKKRKAHIYAEYSGGGFSLEGWKVTIPDLNGDSYKKALSEALTKAQKETIDLLVPHGVGTTVADSHEAKAINEVFGRIKPPITALKPYVGHNLGSCCLLETAILMMALEKGFIPATLNVKETDPKLGIDLVTAPKKSNLKTIVKMACGFAGYDACVVFRKIGQ